MVLVEGVGDLCSLQICKLEIADAGLLCLRIQNKALPCQLPDRYGGTGGEPVAGRKQYTGLRTGNQMSGDSLRPVKIRHRSKIEINLSVAVKVG